MDDVPPYYGNRLTHAACLEKLCLGAMMRGDAERAFRCIDRRCRIAPAPAAYHFLLRAEALEARSERAAALESLQVAIELAPFDIQANRRMLAWGQGPQRLRAAQILCERDDDRAALIEAAKVLKRGGRQAVGSIRVFDAYIRGWAAWNGLQAPELVLLGDDFEDRVRLTADPHRILKKSGFKNGAAFEWPRDPNKKPRRAELRCAAEILQAERISSKIGHRGLEPPLKPAATGGKPGLTVVVPIYRDFEATRTCLESVRREIANLADCKLILVNDASPETKIAPYLKKFAKSLKALLLTNPHNLGFVGSVNRALGFIDEGDIVLLNADTILPGTALRRLQKTAHRDSRIGTITPLSNNGEFTSFPVALRANPLPTMKELAALDRSAAKINKGAVVDIPSGIGFCLFISARCFKAVGGLSDSFQGGYLEDVDFCLRAREKGFRNICDPAVFVAHAGSRSFLADKHNLVVHNLPIIEERFPYDHIETQAFIRHDPLLPARASLEKVMSAKAKFDLLIVTGEGIAKAIAEERARGLSQKGLHVWLAVVADETIGFVNAAAAMPRSLRFRWDDEAARKDLRSYLQGLRFSRIELTDPARLPDGLLPMFLKPGRSLDLVLADGTWMLGLEKAAAGAKGNASQSSASVSAVLSKASRIVAPDKDAQCFAQHLLPERNDIIIVESAPAKPRQQRRAAPPSKSGNPICGIISYGRASDDFRLILELAAQMRKRTKAIDFVILGETFDDLALLAQDNVFITAAFETGQFASLVKLYRIDKLFAATRRPLFGHPLTREAHRAGLPLCYFDWSFGERPPARHDLALSPELDAKAIAPLLAAWMSWRQ